MASSSAELFSIKEGKPDGKVGDSIEYVESTITEEIVFALCGPIGTPNWSTILVRIAHAESANNI
jgi:hypothetical protein